MPFLATNNRHPEGCETLDLETAYRHNWNVVEYVRIGVLEKDILGETGTISFQLVQYSQEWKCKALQACLLETEIDMVIEGLQKAKVRMKELQDANAG